MSFVGASEKVFAIIAAAGSGQRMGAGKVKVLRTLGNQSVLEHALIPFLNLHIPCVVMASADHYAEYQEMFASSRNIYVVPGGATRGESVSRGLNFIGERFNPNPKDLVLVHDGARCLITPVIIERVIASAREYRACIPATPVTDTIKRISSAGKVSETLDRSTLVSVQTPQGFHYSVLQAGYSSYQDLHATDDAGIVEKIGDVVVVDGDESNIKITKPIDLILAEAILAQRAKS